MPSTTSSSSASSLRHRVTRDACFDDSSDVLTPNTDDFIIGDRVWVNGTKPGFIQFIGETQFAPGEWAGVVLDDAIGKNDGSISGVRYFQCEPKRGIFARLHRLTRRAGTASNGTPTSSHATSVSKKQGSQISPTSSVKSGVTPTDGTTRTVTTISNSNPSPRVGDRVIVNATSGIKNGTLRFLGKAEFAPGQWAGVELDKPEGKNDGSVAGRRYFTCKMKHGLFAPAHKVLKSNGVTTVRVTRMTTSSTPLHRRTGSHESLNSSLSSASSIARAGRVRLGVTALTSTQKPLRSLGSTTTNNALQETLREKEEHIEQLLKERDLERSDVARAAIQVEHAEQQLAQVRNENQKLLESVEGIKSDLTQKLEDLELEKNEFLLQQEEDKRKIEDLQFRLEEESIARSDFESQCEESKTTLAKLQAELETSRKSGHQSIISLGSPEKEKDDRIFQLETTLETKKSELGIVQQRLTVTQEELNRSEERHKKQLEVIDDLNLKLSRYESFSAELTEELQNLKTSCSDLERQQLATEDRCKSLSMSKSALEEEVSNMKLKLDQQMKHADEEKSNFEIQIDQLRDQNFKLQKQITQLADDHSRFQEDADRVVTEKSISEQKLAESLEAKANLELQLSQTSEDVKKLLEQEINKFSEEKSKLEEKLQQISEEKLMLNEEVVNSRNETQKIKQQLQWATDDKSRLEKQFTQTSDDTMGQLTSLNVDLDESRREIERLQKVMLESDDLHQKLQEKFKLLEEQNCSDVDALKKSLLKSEECLKAKDIELELLHEQIRDALGKLDSQMLEIKQLQNEEKKHKEMAETTQSSLQSRIHELTSLNETEKVKQDEEAKRILENHILEISKFQTEVKKAKEELNLASDLCVEREKALSRATQEKDELMKEIKMLQSKCEHNTVELESLRKEKELTSQSDKSRGELLANRMQEITNLTVENQKIREMVEMTKKEMDLHLQEMRVIQEDNLGMKKECERMREDIKMHVHEKEMVKDDYRKMKEELEKTKCQMENERKTWEVQIQERSSQAQVHSGQVGQLEAQVVSLKVEVKRLQEEHSAHREDIMEQMKQAIEQNKAMEELDSQLKIQEDTLEKLQVQLFQSEEDCERMQENLTAVEKVKEDLLKENQLLTSRLENASTKKVDVKGNIQKLEEEKSQLENKVVELQVALQQTKASVNGTDLSLKSFQEEKEAFQGQIDFLNSVIVDMQKKNDELSNKIKVLEEGDTLDLNLNGVKAVIAPRLFCDICDRFDVHDTEDCPTQASEPEVPHSRHQGKRKEDRPYCETCEVFGHWTKDCDDNETF